MAAVLTPLWDSEIPAIAAAIDALFAPVFNQSATDLESIRLSDQRSPSWLLSRKLRLTASNFGAAAGLSPYCSPRGLLLQMLFQTFRGNEATRYGTESESGACDAYIATMNRDGDTVVHTESGLSVSSRFPFLGASPDGIVTALSSRVFAKVPPRLSPTSIDSTNTGLRFALCAHSFNPDVGIVTTSVWTPPTQFPHKFLLEIKCPFRKRLYGCIPSYYYAQIQGCMEILELPYAHFYVWTPTATSLDCHPRNVAFWREFLYPRLHAFYFHEFMPLAFLESRGLLQHEPGHQPNQSWLLPRVGVSAQFIGAVYEHCAKLGQAFLAYI